MDGFSKASAHKGEGERPPVPFEIAQSLAWGMLAAQFVSLALIAIVLPRRIGPDWKRQIGVRRPAALHVFLVLLIVPGFILNADVIQTVFTWATGVPPPPPDKTVTGLFRDFPWPLTALAIAIGPGVVEEFWCRGFLGRQVECAVRARPGCSDYGPSVRAHAHEPEGDTGIHVYGCVFALRLHRDAERLAVCSSARSQ